MNRIFTTALVVISAILICITIAIPASRAEDEKAGKDDNPNVSEGLYALCTSAPCVPDPENKDSKAICSCEVNTGINFGYTTCDTRMPKTGEYGVTEVISTYSFAQGPSKPMLSCPKGKP